MIPPQTGRRIASLVGAGAVVAFAAILTGPAGSVAAAAMALLVVVWRHDNNLGTCLPLAVLFLLICGVLALLIVLMRVTHPG